MITVENLIKRLQHSVRQGYIALTDVVVVLGAGNKKSGLINNLTLPKVRLSEEAYNEANGSYHLGIVSNKNIIQDSPEFNFTPKTEVMTW